MPILKYHVTPATVSNLQPLYKSCDNTDIDDQMHWETESKPSQNVILMKNEWSEKELDLANHQLIPILNSSTQVYHKVQIVADEGGK